MTNSSVAKTSNRFPPSANKHLHPDEERIGQRYEASRRRRVRFIRWAFIIAVAAPTAIAALYYGLWASPRYVSETQFIVRSDQGSQSAPGGSVLRPPGGVRDWPFDDDSNAVFSYLGSRDAVVGLEAALPLRKIYARDQADALARFPQPFFGDSFEHLYWYYGDRVTAFSDVDTGIITIQAQAFRPEDAQAIARQLLRRRKRW